MESENSSGLLRLPSEIIEFILQDECLSSNDVCAVAKTCAQLRDTCQSNEIWKRKLQCRWPKLLIRYPRNRQHDWLQEYQKCHWVEKEVQKLLIKMSPTYYKLEELSSEAFADFMLLMEEKNAGEIIINNLMELIKHKDIHEHLTIKYYAAKVLRYILHQHLTEKWKKHLALSPDQQGLEEGAVLLAQWCQPTEDITQNAVSDQLDNIAQQVLLHLPKNVKDAFKQDMLPDTWNTGQERVILEALNHTLFTEMTFSGNSEDYYNENNSYIDKVLQCRRGIPISLSVVYVSLARRLGVHLECVNYPAHFLIKWKEHPMATPDKQYTYIDVFDQGKFRQDSEVYKQPTDAVPPVTVYERMARNLIQIGRQQGRIGDNLLCLRNALELYLLINEDDIDMKLLYLRINLHLSVNLAEVKEKLQSLISINEARMGLVAYLMSSAEKQMLDYEEKKNAKTVSKLREENKEVVFSVGMVMKHKRYDYMCVIYGWDSTCQASREWIVQMGVHNLPKKDQQPFYNVLVEDGSNRYAAQENLFHPNPDSYCAIPHPEVGKFFQRFTGQFYLPNDEKEEEYPDDPQVTQTVVTEVNLANS